MEQLLVSFIYIIPPLVLVIAIAIFVIKIIPPVINFLNEKALQVPVTTQPSIIQVGTVLPQEQKEIEDKKKIVEDENNKFADLQKRFITPKLNKKIKTNFDGLGKKKTVRVSKKKKGE